MMKMYLFQNLDNVSDRFHPDGGLIIIASDRKAAVKIVEQNENIKLDWSRLTAEYAIEAKEEVVYVFPDAGCCG